MKISALLLAIAVLSLDLSTQQTSCSLLRRSPSPGGCFSAPTDAEHPRNKRKAIAAVKRDYKRYKADVAAFQSETLNNQNMTDEEIVVYTIEKK